MRLGSRCSANGLHACYRRLRALLDENAGRTGRDQCSPKMRSPMMPTTTRATEAIFPDTGGLVQQDDSGDRRADGPDAGPGSVGAADRQVAQCQRQQDDAARGGNHEANAGPEPRKALGFLQQHRPDDLEQAGDRDHEPGHARVMVPTRADAEQSATVRS